METGIANQRGISMETQHNDDKDGHGESNNEVVRRQGARSLEILRREWKKRWSVSYIPSRSRR